MTMQQMNECLEKRGFEVERAYIKDLGVYRFVIKKNGNLLGASFKYPVNVEWYTRNKLMNEFLEKIVRDFEQRFCITDMDVASWYPDPEQFWTKENPHVYISTARGCGKSLYNDELWKAYVNADNEMTKNIYKRMVNSMYGANSQTIREAFETLNDKQKTTVYRIIGEVIGNNNSPEIKDVIFNDPATIVFWADGTKTVVKCQEDDEFDPEKGLTMAIVKKVYGNKGSYCNVIKKWTEPYYEKQAEIENQKIINEALDALAETAKKILGSVPTPTIKLNIESKKSDA